MTLPVDWLDPGSDSDIAAGNFASWLTMMATAIEQGGPSDVPCGDCTACCQGSYFIHVAPDESRALARIPAQLLFPAPAAPSGHQLLGYDGEGCCPLLDTGRDTGDDTESCTIYEDRPRTCRTYDCRIFAATGLAEPGTDKGAIMRRAGRWRFDYADESERIAHAALRTGARFLVDEAQALAPLVPGNATQLAMLVVRSHAELLALYNQFCQDEPNEEKERRGATLPVVPAVLERLRLVLSRQGQQDPER